MAILTAPPTSLALLDGSNGFRLDGVAAGDNAGYSVSGAGDVNGDGFADVIVGAGNAVGNSGASYVVFGRPSGFAPSIELGALNGADGFQLNGAAVNVYSGASVSGAGDVNGDGFADLIVGARGADHNGLVNSGASYVVFGHAGGFAANINLGTVGTPGGAAGFRLDGAAVDDAAGSSVSGAGDINGDGFADLIVRAAGVDAPRVPFGGVLGVLYVVFGHTGEFAPSINLSALTGADGFRLTGTGNAEVGGLSSVQSMSAAGDVNGDGFADVIVGAPTAGISGDSGASYVVFGKAGGFGPSVNLSALNGADGFRLAGAALRDQTGSSVSGAGDVNGDGFDDLIVGAPFDDTNGVNSGASYVVFGHAGAFAASVALGALTGADGFRLDGVTGGGGVSFVGGGGVGDQSGSSVSAAGDVNGDGFGDVIVGAFRADPNTVYNAGASYVVFGRPSGFAATMNLSALTGANGFRLAGAARDQSGRSVSAAGDVNGDGFADLIVGALGASPNGAYSGASYVVFGGNFTGAGTLLGTAGNDVLAGTAAADRMFGDAGNDRLIGGAGNDELFGNDGDDRLIGGGGDDLLDGGAGKDTADYSGSPDSVTVSLLITFSLLKTAAQNTGGGGTDTLIGIENLIGGDFDDTLSGNVLNGNAGNDTLIGIGGDNVLDGGAGTDTADFSHRGAVTVSLLITAAQDTGGGFTDTLTGIENLIGGDGSDTLTGDGSANVLAGGKGNDTLDGGAGADTADFSGSPGRVTVSLSITSLQDTGQGFDSLIGIENLLGGAFDDRLTGDGSSNILVGGEGNDTLDGGAGTDAASYDHNPSRVTVSLLATGAQDTVGAGLDRLTGIEDLIGSAFDDVLTGNGSANTLIGGIGDDRLAGNAGDDLLDGGAGADTADFSGSSGTVTVSLLVTGSQVTGGGTDTLIGIENLLGGDFDDALTGNGSANTLIGGAGSDRLEGDAGNDDLVGGSDFDVLVGGAGNDHLFGDANPEVLDAGRVIGGQGDIMLGGEGNDTYHVDSPLDFVDEGFVFPSAGFGGVDTVESTSDFFWDVYGIGETVMIMEGARDPENDGTTIIGGVLDNELIGNSGTNVIFGRGGSDTYRSGDGVDFMSLSLLGVPETLYAGVNGVNTIVVEKRSAGPFSYDIVFEFESGKDRLDVSDYGFASAVDVMALGVNDGLGNSYFVLGDGLDYLYMVGLTASQLSAGDFLV